MAKSEEILAHLPRLRRYARALTGDRARAEDLVQDCVERALNRLHLWQAGTDLRAWLFTIMHNLHANAVRHARRAPPIDALDDEMQIAAPEASGVALSDIEAALQTLPEDQRRVLLLVSLEEMSYEEVGALLQIPVGTVMSRLHRARERLRLLFARERARARSVR